MTTPRFSLLVPVKNGHGAKTRLAGMEADGRGDLMAAFARDAISAARRTPLVEVYVVGDASALRELGRELDVPIVADEGDGDLNQALRRAAARVAMPGRGVAVMLGDLPCLRTDDLELALSRDGRAYVADASGTGTTLLLTPPGAELDPHFGRDSARAHAASGAAHVAGELSSLRLDVDTSDDLDDALALGVGAHTAAALDRLGWTSRRLSHGREQPNGGAP
ncbi:2-phospho-L-lactate/phosphoenolpyruvate guanylyltransferase [Marmoricola sp. URHA0025 HA25]